MRDPVLRFLFQPTVTVLGLDHRLVAARLADMFLIAAIAMSSYKIVTAGGESFTLRTVHLCGAIVLHWWMRWCAMNGSDARKGPLGLMHVLMRTLLVVLVATDASAIHAIWSTDAGHGHVELIRPILQGAEDLFGASALYVSICAAPAARRAAPSVLAV